MSFPMDPKTKLSVYTGEFIIQARIVAMGGDHLVEGKLRTSLRPQRMHAAERRLLCRSDVIGK